MNLVFSFKTNTQEFGNVFNVFEHLVSVRESEVYREQVKQASSQKMNLKMNKFGQNSKIHRHIYTIILCDIHSTLKTIQC